MVEDSRIVQPTDPLWPGVSTMKDVYCSYCISCSIFTEREEIHTVAAFSPFLRNDLVFRARTQ